MYKPEDLIKEDILRKIPITEGVRNLAEIFGRKMNLNYVSTRGAKALKSAGCETIGDVYYFILDHKYDIGYKTAIDILFNVIDMLLPCQSAGEYEKAFLLSRTEVEIVEANSDRVMTDYELMRFRFNQRNLRRSTGTLAEILHMDRKEFEAAVLRGMEKEARMLGKEENEE